MLVLPMESNSNKWARRARGKLRALQVFYGLELLTFYQIVLWPVNWGVDIISFNAVRFNERWWDWISFWIIDLCDRRQNWILNTEYQMCSCGVSFDYIYVVFTFSSNCIIIVSNFDCIVLSIRKIMFVIWTKNVTQNEEIFEYEKKKFMKSKHHQHIWWKKNRKNVNYL